MSMSYKNHENLDNLFDNKKNLTAKLFRTHKKTIKINLTFGVLWCCHETYPSFCFLFLRRKKYPSLIDNGKTQESNKVYLYYLSK